MKVQSVQPTPNPNAFKFLLDGKVVQSGVKNYTAAADAAGDPLAKALFGIEGVDTLFFCEDFITVSMVESADWRAVHDEVVKQLQDHEPDLGDAAATTDQAGAPAATTGDGDPELMQKIMDLLEDRVMPALAGDGGGLEILGLDGKTLSIRYQGACNSCPSSIAGTLTAIENLIHTEIDDTVQVVTA